MSDEKILIVEDERPIREMIAFHLGRAGYRCVEAENSSQARELLADEAPVLALIDWMLPDTSGLELTRMLRRDERYNDLAIIMLTARGEEQDRVSGLNSGADDYISKPFSPRELIARIQAVLRRTVSDESDALVHGSLVLDAAAHRVSVDGQPVHLGPTEFRLLRHLMQNPNRVYNRTQLLDRVWGANVYVEERTVDVHIRRLRKALSDFELDAYIQTVRGAGYRFSASTD